MQSARTTSLLIILVIAVSLPVAELAAQTELSAASMAALEAPADVAAVPDYALRTESGLAYHVLREGDGGPHPTLSDSVVVHYTGWQTNGELFDSSVQRGRPATFGLDMIIEGWVEALQLMEVGELTRVWVPADLAYGENPGGGRPGGMLVFDIELLSINSPHGVPSDVSFVPADAETTESGLSSRIITAGNGDRHPAASSTVRVHYTGWTMDGEMIDSSVERGTPAEFPLDAVIPGWTEGVQLMVEGETRRLWIPADLAYGDNPRGGEPAGMLVFDVELISILD